MNEKLRNIFSILLIIIFIISTMSARKNMLYIVYSIYATLFTIFFLEKKYSDPLKKSILTKFNPYLLSSIIIVFLWCSISTLWGIPVELNAIIGIAKLAGCFLIGGSLMYVSRKLCWINISRFSQDMAIGISVAAAIIFLLCILSRIPSFPSLNLETTSIRTNHSIVFISLIIYPILFILRKNKNNILFTISITLTILASFSSHILASKISIVAGALFFLFTYLRSRIATLVLGGSIISSILLFPLAIPYVFPPETTREWQWLPDSSHHRLDIWRYTNEKILEKPVLGWGYNAARYLTKERETIQATLPGDRVIEWQVMPRYTHNVSMQLWLELGGIGTMLFIGFLICIFSIVYRSTASPCVRACSNATIASFFVIAMTSYGFWEHWWLLSMWFAGTLLCWVHGNSEKEKA